MRALARKLDVDLNLVQASGPDGTITRADVERAAKSLTEAGPAEPLRGMRRAMAQRMAAAHAEVVPASVTDEADIGDWPAGEDATIRLVRAIAAACKAEPSLNAWYNAAAGERRLVKRIDIGIAVDTEGGLIVPVLRNVGERDARDLRAGLDRMRADAAARSIPPEELRGATITLSNFGMIGGRFASLVVVPPQVAIIGAGRIGQRVMVHEGQPAVRARAAAVADLRPPRGDRRRGGALSRCAERRPRTAALIILNRPSQTRRPVLLIEFQRLPPIGKEVPPGPTSAARPA